MHNRCLSALLSALKVSMKYSERQTDIACRINTQVLISYCECLTKTVVELQDFGKKGE